MTKLDESWSRAVGGFTIQRRGEPMRGQYFKEAWLEIARTGRFQDAGGAWHDFTADKLAQIAAGYNPARREAPLVLGHPATDGPAHGWIKALNFNGRKLLAKVACVSDSVKKAVAGGLYKYVSMSLYGDGGLRHVGLLGATPPAITGLAPASFSGRAAIVLNFSQERKKAMDLEEPQRKIEELETRLDVVTQALEEVRREIADLKGESFSGRPVREPLSAKL